MQQNQYSNDPYYTQPTERNPQAVPPPQDAPYYTPGGGYPQTAGSPPPPYNPDNDYQERRAAYRERERGSATYGLAKLIDFLKWVLLVLEVIFTIRFVLKLLGADPANPFASFMYGLSGFFLAPFSGLVHNPTFSVSTYHVFEWTTLIGMLVYALFFWIVWLLVRTTISRPQEPIS
jgi:hypothetical protein